MPEPTQRTINAIVVLADQQEVDNTETALATAFREAWPDWVFDRAIDTNLTGPQGERYIRLDRLSWDMLELGEDQEGRETPDPRVANEIRDSIENNIQEMPEGWREI